MRPMPLVSGLLGLLIPFAASGCRTTTPEVSGSTVVSETYAGGADGSTLAAFKGKYVSLAEDGTEIPGFSATITVDIAKRQVTMLVPEGAAWAKAFDQTVDGKKAVETYTVSEQDWSGFGWPSRRRIETTVTHSGTTIAKIQNMYSWTVSPRVWEDWKHYKTLSRSLDLKAGVLTLRVHELNVGWDERNDEFRYKKVE